MKLDYVTSALVLSLAACGSVEEPADVPSGDPVPTVLAYEPADHAVGIREDAEIKLTFSEPMDAASVEAAVVAPQLTTPTFIWNLEQTQVRIVPGTPLAYAEGVGDDPTVIEALSYEVVLQPTAVSKQGVPLTDATAFVFSTLKRLETSAPVVDDLTLHVSSGGQVALPDSDLRVGDTNINTTTRALMTFNISALTDRAVEIESAWFSAVKTAVVGTPFSINPSITSYHVTFSDLVAGYSVPPLDSMGLFATIDTAGAKQDVTAQLNDDLAHRVERLQQSQFRLQFDSTSDNDAGQDYALFGRDTLKLTFTYLSP